MAFALAVTSERNSSSLGFRVFQQNRPIADLRTPRKRTLSGSVTRVVVLEEGTRGVLFPASSGAAKRPRGSVRLWRGYGTSGRLPSQLLHGKFGGRCCP